jgi:hypothetical protein
MWDTRVSGRRRVKKLIVPCSVLLLACIATSSSMADADPKRDPVTYEYQVRVGAFAVDNVFTSLVHYRVPDSSWVCGIDRGARGGVSAVCATRGLAAVVTMLVDCDHGMAVDSRSINLNTLEPGVFATVSLVCKRSGAWKLPEAPTSVQLPPLPAPESQTVDDGF